MKLLTDPPGRLVDVFTRFAGPAQARFGRRAGQRSDPSRLPVRRALVGEQNGTACVCIPLGLAPKSPRRPRAETPKGFRDYFGAK
jgi:hypothetical protein